MLRIDLWQSQILQLCKQCIAGHTSVNKQKRLRWLTTGIHQRDEIIYTRPKADMGRLIGVSLQSKALGLDMISHRDWVPAQGEETPRCGPWAGNRIGKDVRPWRCMVKRKSCGQYGGLSSSPSVPQSLSHIRQQSPFQGKKCESYIFIKKSDLPPCFFIIHLFIIPVWYIAMISSLCRYGI